MWNSITSCFSEISSHEINQCEHWRKIWTVLSNRINKGLLPPSLICRSEQNFSPISIITSLSFPFPSYPPSLLFLLRYLIIKITFWKRDFCRLFLSFLLSTVSHTYEMLSLSFLPVFSSLFLPFSSTLFLLYTRFLFSSE